MDTSRNNYVMAFAVLVCVVISAMLALTATALAPIQAAAAEFDRQKNVMLAAGLVQPGDPRPRAELERLYQERVVEHVIELKSGELRPDLKPQDVAALKDRAERARYRVLLEARDAGGKVEGYVIPVAGKGLWSILYGYLALAADAKTVRGITFYKHGETPGLGGEVENPAWTGQWPGKSILDAQGRLVSITVKKGKVDPAVPAEKAHFVDGLSGATITSNGVSKFVKADLESYRRFFEKIWQGRG